MTSRTHPMGEIEHWRNEALIFARSDNLGNLLKTSLELMNSVIMSGSHSKTLPLKVQALRMECASVQDDDPNSDDESRMLHYGVTSTVCAMIISLTGNNETEPGMSANQLRVEEIEQWRIKALHFSRSDMLGQIIKGSLELMQRVIATGLRSQTLPLKIKAMSMECESAMADDPNREDSSRSLHYGVIFAICTLLEAMTSKENEKAPEIKMAPIRGVRRVRFEIEEDVSPSSTRDGSISMDDTNRGTDIQERRLLETTSPEEVEQCMSETTASTTNIINDIPNESDEEKPSLTYREMIVEALENSKTKQLSSAEICQYICAKYPYYRSKPEAVEKSVGPCLSKHFRSIASKHTMWRMYYRQKGSRIQEMNTVEIRSPEEPDICIADNNNDNDTTIECEGGRPQLPFREMIIHALNNSEIKQLSTAEICEYICNKYPHYRDKVETLEKSINRCLSKHFRPIVSGLTMWRMYYKHKRNNVQGQHSVEATDDEESSRKKGRMAHHSFNEIDAHASMNTEHDWMNAVDMTNFGENISPIIDQQVRNANLSANISPFVDHSSTSMHSQADEEPQAHAVESPSAFVDFEPSGIDNDSAKLEKQKADNFELENIVEKPSKSYRKMITEILQSRPAEYLSTAQIAKSIRDQYPYYREKYTERTMKNICNTTLSRNFQKINTSNMPALWTIRSENTESSIVIEPPASMTSPIDEDPQERTTACSFTSSSVHGVSFEIDNIEWRLEEQESQTSETENADKKPSKNYREMIIDILGNSPTKFLTAAQIAKSIRDQYPYYRENYTEQAMLNGIYPTLSKRFNKAGVINGQALWSTEDNAADVSIVEESLSELPKTYRYQIEEALKSSGPRTSMEISQYICEKYPTKCNAYDLRQRFSSCLFKHFKKTITNGGVTLWSIRLEEEDKHTQFPLESAISNANISINESVPHIAESSKEINEAEKSTEKLKELIEGVLRNSETGVLDYADISDAIYDQYPGSSIAELNREINTCLSENFEQSFSCDGHPMWSIRSEIQVNAVNASVESTIREIDECNTVPIVSHSTIGKVTEGQSKTYKEKIEDAIMNSDKNMISVNEICEFIRDKYPHSDISKLRKNVGNRLSDYFQKTVLSNGECLWSMRPEDTSETF
ncbi:hypothetical protein PRIPAC_80941 [Pristionchus pacificus]|nr:hypothetical protein PRIPAC_80941 [Pristionchus pacificus]